MNETNLNTELLTAEAKGRKHIPFAVFAVILIHVVLFLVLLVAAGCRAKARAKREAATTTAQAEVQSPAQAQSIEANSAIATEAAPSHSDEFPAPLAAEQPAGAPAETVVATEPVIEQPVAQNNVTAQPNRRASRPRAQSQQPDRSSKARTVRTYTVKAGDNLGAIARKHGITVRELKEQNRLKSDLIRAGQELRVSSDKAAKRTEA